MLYDADRVREAASVADERALLDAQRSLFLDANDPDVAARALADGIPPDWLDHARRSPVHALVARYRVALPLHPEYRTMPMVWYVPPLSPIVNALEEDGYEADPDALFPAVDKLRIPLEYLANLLTAGDVDVVRDVLRRLSAMRGYMRKQQVLGEHDESLPHAVGMDGRDLEDMYRLLAIAKYDERYVIPQAHAELADRLAQHGANAGCSLDFDGGPGNCGAVSPPPPSSERFMLPSEDTGHGGGSATTIDLFDMLRRRGAGAEGDA
jgi:nitrate reductase / nitrite oxidoreductase, beta subunit